MKPLGASSTPRHRIVRAAPLSSSWAARSRVPAEEAQAASMFSTGTPGRPSCSITFCPLAMSALTLATSTMSRSSSEDARVLEGLARCDLAEAAVPDPESAEGVHADPGDHDLLHATTTMRMVSMISRPGRAHQRKVVRGPRRPGRPMPVSQPSRRA
jgi:hypothetical protein